MRRSRRGYAVLLVLWVVAIAGVVVATVQSASIRQAITGQESLARVRASWAARAGVEATIAALGYHTERGDNSDAYAVIDDMADAAEGSLLGAEWLISYTEGDKEILGPRDAHSRIHVTLMSANSLLYLPGMTEDVVAAIQDWTDEDDDVRPLGAEMTQYLSLPYPYRPRNAPPQSLMELELVLGAVPEYVRGEDWNLNGLLDANEDDGEASWPPDNADGELDRGWGAVVTTRSVGGGLGASGEPRLVLRTADAGEIARRLGVDNAQADVIAVYAPSANSLGDFLVTPLNQMCDPATNQPIDARASPLTCEQLSLLFNETALDEIPSGVLPGKLNVNTTTYEVLEYLPGMTSALADAIIGAQADAAGSGGFASIADLLDVPGMRPQRLAQLSEFLDVRSNVYEVTCRGRDVRSGIEVEVVATIDRSTLPIVIREYRVR